MNGKIVVVVNEITSYMAIDSIGSGKMQNKLGALISIYGYSKMTRPVIDEWMFEMISKDGPSKMLQPAGAYNISIDLHMECCMQAVKRVGACYAPPLFSFDALDFKSFTAALIASSASTEEEKNGNENIMRHL